MPGFIEELRRRNVVRVGVAYLIIAWITAQVGELVLDSFEAPAWVMKALLLLLALGLPIALFFAWAFELTPEGLKKEADVERDASIAQHTGRKLNRAIAVMLIATLVYIAVDKLYISKRAGQPTTATTSETAEPQESATQAAPVNERSVAVLPFLNISADPAQDYFSDGITEEIINAVVKIPGLSVPARTSVFGFKNYQGDVREIGESLGVAHVLEGSVRSQGNTVRITAQLIKVTNGFHLWSETFDRELENIFAVQEEIATAIASQLIGKLGVELDTVPNKTRNMAAYDTYLRGREALRRREDAAVTLLEQATEADPDFAPAWAALAIAYQSIPVDIKKALAAADKALALDPDNVDALNAKGASLRNQHQWLAAEKVFDRALAIDPSSAELLEDYAEFLAYVGRTDEALLATTRGMEIDASLNPLIDAHVEALLSTGHGDKAYEIAADLIIDVPESEVHAEWWWYLPVWRNPAPEAAMLETLPPPSTAAPEPLTELDALGKRLLQDRTDREAIATLKQNFQSQPAVSLGYFTNHFFTLLLIYANEIDVIMDKDLATEDSAFFMREGIWEPFYKAYRQHHLFPEYLERIGIIAYWDATRWPGWCERGPDGNIACQ